MDSEQEANQKKDSPGLSSMPPEIGCFNMKGKALDDFIVGTVPTVMYIPDFITSIEESHLLDCVYNCPSSKWKSLKNRRLQNWGGIVHEKGLLPQQLPPWLVNIADKIYEESGLFPLAINHVLINEYLPNQGIMPHQDGPAYYPVVAILSLGSPVVMEFAPHSSLQADMSTDDLSGDSSAEADMWAGYHRSFSIILMPRSLLIFKDDVYTRYLHGIRDNAFLLCSGALNEAEACRDKLSVEGRSSGDSRYIQRTETRVSLTFRLVLKVHKKLFKF
ncbi:hypothetical protein MLD38_025421 [Melastoma candidum]|uniref:Uncharacterized protein n=1 Tax=Melastoma candidum TaxID=119954 RepID=A0ACB9NVE0_9MYRT|nr:hypothetical protein MLD38_025421 [Melastoma candidum]